MKWLLILIILAVVAVLILASRKPNSFRVERKILIHAESATVFAYINDFHQWTHWSPWENIAPNLTRSYSGPDMGVGAHYAWQGNKNMGQGNMTILESTPHSFIKIALQFIKPFAANNIAEFTLTQQGDNTEVAWAMYGPSPLISKVMGLFINMDKMIGTQFETGLTNLKNAAEKAKQSI
ncbi:polyketide cyclase [Formosimonas limnophila]|uniref:Polyketide cyclase n=1 Tax=Formosimonas limnophila TaxID=1384487 RepID=A0A8J3CL43_9BURK|nr:SRPBCC family protein [Formosimonas limnophila]GHA71990.1 polyketide cyclase [Formosimonas limnophila]